LALGNAAAGVGSQAASRPSKSLLSRWPRAVPRVVKPPIVSVATASGLTDDVRAARLRHDAVADDADPNLSR